MVLCAFDKSAVYSENIIVIYSCVDPALSLQDKHNARYNMNTINMKYNGRSRIQFRSALTTADVKRSRIFPEMICLGILSQ